MDLDNDDNVWIYGRTEGGDEWPITPDVFTTDAKSLFITQFNPELSQIITSTAIGAESIFGGGGGGAPVAFLVDRCDRVYISAFQAVSDLPLTDDAIFQTGGFYLAAFEDALETLSFATYYTENHVDGGTSRFDKKGVVYQGVCSGGGFNTTANAFATDQNTGWDVGVFKIDFQLSGVNAAFSAPSELDGCAPHEISFSNFSVGDVFDWDFGDGNTSNEFEPTHIFEEPGTYTVTMIASDSLSCNLADTVSVNIDIFAPEDFEPSFDAEFDCETSSVTLINTTGGNEFLDFYWIINGDTLYTSYNANHQFDNPTGEQTVSLLAIDDGCQLDQAVTETLSGFVDVQADLSNVPSTDCSLTISFENSSINGETYLWNFGDGTTSTEESPVHTYATYGTYDVTLTAINPNSCNGEDEIATTINLIQPPAIDGNINLSQTGVCGDLTLEASLENTDNMAGYTWFVDGEEVGTDDSFTLNAAAPDFYEVEVQIVPTGCSTPIIVSDTIRLVSQLPIDLGPERDICYYESSIILENLADLPEATYEWLPGGEVSPTLEVTAPGTYTVVVTSGGCSDSRTIDIGFSEEAFGQFETEICEGVSERISVPVSHQSFLWDNGATENSIVISRSGTYTYTYVDDGGCEQSGEFIVTGVEPEPTVYIPNSFTPNGDGINDLFRPSVVDEMQDFSFRVYNRWGKLVFETADPTEGWNGSGPNEDYFVPPGAYVYQIKWRGVCQSETVEKTGTLNLIR
jgi:gliding motility-associated-like protein